MEVFENTECDTPEEIIIALYEHEAEKIQIALEEFCKESSIMQCQTAGRLNRLLREYLKLD